MYILKADITNSQMEDEVNADVLRSTTRKLCCACHPLICTCGCVQYDELTSRMFKLNGVILYDIFPLFLLKWFVFNVPSETTYKTQWFSGPFTTAKEMCGEPEVLFIFDRTILSDRNYE